MIMCQNLKGKHSKPTAKLSWGYQCSRKINLIFTIVFQMQCLKISEIPFFGTHRMRSYALKW
jgi:hypothetical protein